MRVPWPFQHLGLKAVSLGIAVALWVAVAGEEVVERGLRIPLELQQFPAGLEVLGEPPALVDVRLRGTSGALARTLPGDVTAVIDLKGARPGRRLYQLTPDQVRSPFGVEVIQVAPASLALEFEEAATRKVPIVATVDGEPAPGYIAGTPIVEPAEVEIVGPKSAIDSARDAISEAVSVAGASAAVKETVSVGLIDPSLRVKSSRVATVTVPVMLGPRERTFRDVPVRLRGVGASLAAQSVPPTVLALVRGSREGVGRVSASEVIASVDLTGLGPGLYTLPVRIETPGAVGVVRIEPETVQITIDDGKRR